MKIFSVIVITLLIATGCNNSNRNIVPQSPTTPTPNIPTNTPPSPTVPTAETVSEAKEQGITVERLNNFYKDGANIDSTKAAFNGRMHEFIEAYRQMIADVGHYLQKNDSLKNKILHWSNRIYFNANGTVDYYLYSNLSGLNLTEEAIFKKSLNEFIKTYKFPMACKIPFAQCSPVTLEP